MIVDDHGFDVPEPSPIRSGAVAGEAATRTSS